MIRTMCKARAAAAAVAVGMTLLHGSAGATVLEASGSGWCAGTFQTCNNTDTSANANTFTGYRAQTFTRSWFAFDLGTLAGRTITSATLSIWNDAGNLPSSSPDDDVFSLYRADAIAYGTLAGGNVLGSVTAGAADTRVSHYVDIALNAAGLAALNAGGLFIFGGATPGASEFFGYTDGVPSARLDVRTGAAAPVPEPGSAALFGLGLLGIGFGLGRRARRGYGAARAAVRARAR